MRIISLYYEETLSFVDSCDCVRVERLNEHRLCILYIVEKESFYLSNLLVCSSEYTHRRKWLFL